MKLRFAVLIGLIWVNQALAEGLALEKLIPKETELLLLTRNLPEFANNFAESPLRKAFDRKEIQDTLTTKGRLIDSRYWERKAVRKLGHSLDELSEAFGGQVLMSVPKVEGLFADEYPSYALVAEIGDGKDIIFDLIKRRLEQEDQDAGEGVAPIISEEEYFGTTLNLRQYETGDKLREGSGWAVVDNVVVIARPVAYLRTMVASVNQGGIAGSWSEERPFQVREKRQEPWNLIFYVQGEALAPLLSGYLNQVRKERRIAEQKLNGLESISAGEESPEALNDVDPMGSMLTEVMKALFGDKLKGVMVSSFAAGKHSGFDLDLIHAGKDGLGGMFSYSGEVKKLSSIVPLDAAEVSVARIDYRQMWNWLSDIGSTSFLSVNPSDSLMFSLFAAAAQVGTEAENQLAESIGTTQLNFSVPEEKGVNDNSHSYRVDVVLHEIRDTAGMVKVMEQMHQLEVWRSSIEPREYLDTPLYVFMMDQGEGRIPAASYAITDDYLIYSTKVSEVQNLLGRLRQKGKQKTFWEQPAIHSSLKALPDGYSALSYEQPGSFLKTIYTGLQMLPDSMPSPKGCQVRPKLEDDAFEGYLGAVVSATY